LNISLYFKDIYEAIGETEEFTKDRTEIRFSFFFRKAKYPDAQQIDISHGG